MAVRIVIPVEVSIFDSMSAAIAYELYAERPDETSWGADPFVILSEKEEAAGVPLIDSVDDE